MHISVLDLYHFLVENLMVLLKNKIVNHSYKNTIIARKVAKNETVKFISTLLKDYSAIKK